MATARASIKPFLLPYVEAFGVDLGTDDLSEIVNLLILDHKRGVCSNCRDKTSEAIAPQRPAAKTEDSLLNDLSNLINQ